MSDRDADLKARLMAQAEVAIDQVLACRPAAESAKWADIEQVALVAGQQVAQAVTRALVTESAGAVLAWPVCPACGQRMKAKGKRRRRVVTESGEVELRRAYYYCGSCHQGLFPPG